MNRKQRETYGRVAAVVTAVAVCAAVAAVGWAAFDGRGAAGGLIVGALVGMMAADLAYLCVVGDRLPSHQIMQCPRATVHVRHTWVQRTDDNVIIDLYCEGVDEHVE